MQIKQQIKQAFDDAENKTEFLQDLKLWIHKELSNHKSQPVDAVRWVPIEKVFANDYNPNSVAKNEMRLLYVSISHDGYTQPIVTVYDKAKDQYVIVDGFHRYTTMKLNKDLYDKTGGMLPVVVIEKSINDRMASTVRHNRARGKHSVTGMANMVFQMLDNGWKDEAICAELGVEADELIRLKHVTGFSKLFENVDYRKAWETKRQIQLKKLYKDSLNESNQPTNN
ncbi:chromosome partitioning protein ParB [bacterium]|nr:chromosome partitioning protein ParB [bacterium]